MASIIEQSNGASARIGSTIRPDSRPVLVYYLIPVFCAGAALVTYILPINDSIQFGVALASVVAVIGFFYLAIEFHIRWKSANYVIASDYVEATGRVDIFKQTTRRIPIAYIRDVTLQQSFLQSFFNISNITIATTNGDTIILENLNDAHRTEAAIWELVLAHSRTVDQVNPMNQKGG